MRQLAFGIRALACACAVLLAPGVPRRAAAQTDPSAVLGGAPLSCGLSGSTFSCASNLTSSGGSDLPITVQLTNGQNTSNPINYTLQATVSGANPTGYPFGSVLSYSGYGQQPSDDYPSLAYVQGPNVTVNDGAAVTVNGATGYPIVYRFNTGGVVVAASFGSPGFLDPAKNPDLGNFNGSQGGTVTVNLTGSILATGNGMNNAIVGQYLPPTLSGIGAFSFGMQGAEGKEHDTDYAGTGGAGGAVNVTNGGTITMSNTGSVPTYGIYAVSQGGEGTTAHEGYAYGGAGNGGAATVVNNGAITNTAPTGIGIGAVSLGGNSNDYTKGSTNYAAAAGNGGATSVTLNAGSSIDVSGTTSIGVVALSSGGNADNEFQGTGGGVTVSLAGATGTTPAATVTTDGTTLSIGVLAISAGNVSEVQPFATQAIATYWPGMPGSVTVINDGSITTSGALSAGIAAISAGGAAIVTSTNSGTSFLGNSGATISADGSDVTVANGGLIRTTGDAAHGIVAASIGGGGGLLALQGSEQSAYLGSNTNNTGMSNGSSVTVTNSGIVETGAKGQGTVAIGIVAQSIGGGGGTATGASRVGGEDADGSGGGNGGTVTVNLTGGGILTHGEGALAVLAQSIGGGGGNGADDTGAFVAVGGGGGNGGTGGTVNVGVSGGTVVTLGDFAGGVLAQSVGGGGGNGGYATSIGAFVSAALGGAGGSGGAGGNVTVANSQLVSTLGAHSIGILAQSVGGGGGNGGAATGIEATGVLGFNLAIGGSAGSASSGGTVTINNSGQIVTAGPDAIAMVAQSVGGGGGAGGASVAQTLAITVPDVPGVSFTAALGGAGGGGGGGGAVTLTNSGVITTTGDGAHGILAQSIGGGGGNGGDSTASSHAIAVGAPSVNIALALGAAGGGGGSGGNVSAYEGMFPNGGGSGSSTASISAGPVAIANVPTGVLGACDATCTTTIFTGGANAAALEVQSIGGGGGNSTAGTASTHSANLGEKGGDTYGLSIGLGAQGGTGGAGGTVNVATGPGTTLTTVGSGSPGILAQSIAGGGGSASGDSFGLSVSDYTANVSAGGNGVGGTQSGTVTIVNGATIRTLGGDSIGILAQSIGGGGGLAGSSDAAATVSASNQAENLANPPDSAKYTATVAVGGTGGAAGDGNTVGVGNTGAISTGGERAYGIEAQSVGGGGGNAGTANAGTQGTNGGTFSANVGVGGTGGAGGNGGAVTVYSSGPIATGGYNAYGILAQSIGGGGGVGADGSVNASTTLSLGVGTSGNGGSAGGGNNASVTTALGGTVATTGDDAAAIVAQSIGGGGGVAGAGCGGASACLAGRNANPQAYPTGYSYSLNVGGSSGASGNALNVKVDASDAIRTAGARSMGIVAQSIGGGGGFVTAAAQNLANTSVAGNPGTNNGTGAPVTVTLESTGSIATSGAGSWGILAQSIGGGGGFAGDPSLALPRPASNTLPRTGTGNAFANTVAVTVNGNITTSGANAHGVFAQAVGGSGGIVAGCCNSATASVLAGNTAQFRSASNASYWGDGGAVRVTQGAGSVIETSGPGSIGIVAQSTGNSAAANNITVDLSGAVIGGTNTGAAQPTAAGILVSGGGAGGNPNTITVEPGASVNTMDGTAGTAIIANSGSTNVVNTGTITGSIDLGAAGTITNNAAGILNPGATLVAGTLTNDGTMNLPGLQVNLTGSFVQGSTGNLAFTYDISAPLAVSGNATLAGTITPTVVTTLLPGSQTLLSASSLSVSASVAHPLLFEWDLQTPSNTVTVSPVANFTPAGVPLGGDAGSVANYLTTAWNNADPQFGTLFATLYNGVPTGATYVSLLDQLSPRATQVPVTALTNLSGQVLGSAMSCPQFEGGTTLLGEGRCVWAKGNGQVTNEYGLGGSVTSSGYHVGGQGSLGPHWRIGAAFGGGSIWASEGNGSKGSGQTYDGSLALKYTNGPWLFAGSLAFANAAYSHDRVIDVPGAVSAVLQSNSEALLFGGRLRAAYDIGFQGWYLRPMGDLDLFYTHTPAFTESGTSPYALAVGASSKVNVAITPAIEIGSRFDLDRATVVRAFANVGMSLLPGNRRSVSASFAGAALADGTFSTTIKSPDVTGNLDLGVQLYHASGLDLRAEYNLRGGDSFLSQGGTLRIGYRF